MAVQILNVSVTNAAKFLCTVPPNASAQFSLATGAGGTVALGLSNTVTTVNGYAVSPGIPHGFTLPPTSKAYDIWGIASVVGPLALGVVITTTA